MTRILVPNDPVKERKRLLGQARHCHDLATLYDDARLKQELSAIGESYERKLRSSLMADFLSLMPRPPGDRNRLQFRLLQIKAVGG